MRYRSNRTVVNTFLTNGYRRSQSKPYCAAPTLVASGSHEREFCALTTPSLVKFSLVEHMSGNRAQWLFSTWTTDKK
ncbi:hypothetical protein TNCT_692821 [Trichonephila clavata]|uniref:Uncharacterized protein n=1 Tax=Trichonephila clavata TaxID=2740835 RepID=A0A8X6LWZ0_TRICU|nr:hypothetical protein TNCT_692821 [Trichonephila clavata]